MRLRSYDGQDQIEEVIRFYFMEKDPDWFVAGIDELPDRVKKVSDLNGSYLHD